MSFPSLCAKLPLNSFCTLALRNVSDKTFPAQTHKYTCRPGAMCILSTPEQQRTRPQWCKGDGAEAAFKFSSPRAPNPCALLPAIWVSLALNCFGRAAKKPVLLLRNDAVWWPNMCDHAAYGHPHDIPARRTARQNDPAGSQQCHNPASNHSQSGSVPLLPTGVWRKTGPGLGRLHSAACSQHGGTSYSRMPRMPKHTAPMVWVTAMWVKRG